MKISVAAIFCLVAVAASASGVTAENIKGRKGLRAAANPDEDKVLAEDEGYWERFLQLNDASIPVPPTAVPAVPTTSAPTPSAPTTSAPTTFPTGGGDAPAVPTSPVVTRAPTTSTPTISPTLNPTNPPGTCDVAADMTCTLAGTDTPCSDIPSEGPADCGATSVEYCYTIENVGDECGDIGTMTTTRSPSGAIEDVLDFLDETNLCPGNSITVCEDDVVDTCINDCYTASLQVAATMAAPAGIDGYVCRGDASYDFCVNPGCEVDIASECSAILPDGSQVPCDEIPTDPQDCVEDLALEYCYTIDNIGQSCGSISSIDRTRSRDDPTGEEVSSDTSSLLSRLDISDYCPDDAPIRFCEQETINSCETGCYATDIVMDATMPDGFSCGAADDFQFCHTPGCKIAVDTSCTLDGTDTDCADIPTESAAECSLKDIEYCYTITNVGGSCGEVSTLERTRNPPGSPVGTVTLTSLIESNRAICPPGSFEGPSEIVVCEKEQVSTCESSSSETEVSVEVAMPGDDFVCTAADDYAFSITAGCNIGAQASCTATLPDGSQTPCDAVPTDPDLCVENMPVEYCYVIDNIGESCGALSTLDRTQSKFTFDGVIASDDSDVLALLPDSGRELCPNDPPIRVCELGQINSCQAACYDSDVFIEASMPDGFTCSTEADLSFCQEPGCEVQVETTCVTDNGTNCADLDPTPETCGATNMQYCYTITNVGESCGEVSKLQRNSFPPGGAQGALDLFGSISDTTICPPDRIEGPSEIVVCEDFVSVNTCDDQCYLTTAEAAVTMNDGSSVCNAGDAYEVCINPGCVIETEMECNATLIDGSTVPCDNLPVASVLTCQNEPYTIEYCYDITNVGPTCGNVSRIQRTRTGMVSDILSTLIPNPAERLICPGDTIRKCEFLAVDSCTEACYDTSVAVETTMPDNFVCQAQDEDAFCVPEPFSEDCNVAVSLDCTMPPESTVNGSGECDAIIPIATRCDDRASVMTWRFNGGDCEQSFNIQEADKFMCTDFGPGGAPTEGTAYVNVISAKDQNEVYFDGEVEVGSLFTMYAPAGGKFNADSIFTVYSDSSKTTILQQSNVHTSCSSNLFLKDRFGAVQLLIFQNDVGLFTCFVQATYAFTFTNEGASSQGTITDFISTTNGVAEDCLDDIPDGQQTILPDETYVMPKQVLIDMTVRQDYNTEVAIRAVTPTGSFFCDSGTSLQFTAGNPNLPIFG